jgi:ABC-type sugar transport system ATPase subunit
MHISASNLSKRFGGTVALDGVTLDIRSGETHGLIGENGAGKSTLGKILAGIHRPDDGGLRFDDQVVRVGSPRDALRLGVAMVHQELAFCPDLSVGENLCMGFYPRRLGVFVDRGAMRRRARAMLGRIGVTSIDPDTPMRGLTTAQEQLVQIAAAVATNARAIVFDEPTSSLAEPDVRRLFDLIGQLKRAGTTIIYVSHRMPELFELCDRISVLRDGRYVGTLDRAGATHDRLVQMMVGRTVEAFDAAHATTAAGAAEVLRVERLATAAGVVDVSLSVHAGEIVGLAGLVGAGRSETARAVFGLDHVTGGQLTLDGLPFRPRSPRDAMRRGVGLVPEDRKRQGLVLMHPIRQNIATTMLRRLSRGGWISVRAERRIATEQAAALRIKSAGVESPVSSLSGGNQQKVSLAKWLARRPKLLIVDEPTRGVDVGAKAAIHAILDQLAAQGTGVLLISSELPELLALSGRVVVLREGKTVGELPRGDATQEAVLRLMAGLG